MIFSKYNFLTLIVFAFSAFFFTACKEEETKLTVTPSLLTFTADDTEEKTVTIETDAKIWNFNDPSAIWINAFRKSDNKILYVSVLNNADTGNPRSASITITAGKSSLAEIRIVQEAKIINVLSASPTSLSFNANETGQKTVSILTDALAWEATKTDQWISLSQSGQTLTVSVIAANTQSEPRSAVITITAGNAPPVTVTVTQNSNTVPPDTNKMPISSLSEYYANSFPLFIFNDPDWEKETWKGMIKPVENPALSYLEVSNFSDRDIFIYCDYINGKFRLDQYTKVAQSENYDGYLRIAILENDSTLTFPFGVNYEISYDAATNVLDFSGTYNGFPICVGVACLSRATGEMVKNTFFTNFYYNLKLQLSNTPSSSFAGNIIRSSSTLREYDDSKKVVQLKERSAVTIINK